MRSYIYLVLILVTTLSKFHEVNSEDGNIIEILFVNDMQYGFYPVNENGDVCLDDEDHRCKGGLARIVKALEISYPLPTTTMAPTSSTTPTTPTTTTPSTSPTTTTPSTSPTSTTKSTTPSTASLSSSSKKAIENKMEEYSASDNILFPNHTLFLNAGNYLHSSNNNWFDLLKYIPAKTALNSLPFSAIAIGADVFQYGETRGLDFVSNVHALVSNVQNSSNEDLIKSKTFPISGVNVTVIGFLGTFDKEKYYGRIKISDPKIAIEAEIKEQKTAGKQIFVAIGTADTELATEIAKIEGMNIVIYSGSNVTGDKDVVLQKIKENSWIATSKPPAAKEPHGLIGNITIHLTENLDISKVEIDQIIYSDREKADDEDITTIESTGYHTLKDTTDIVITKTLTTLGGDESCSALEYGLGDLVTDAMKRAMEESYEDGIAMWNLRNSPPLIEANTDINEAALYDLLGKGNDENMYVLSQSPKEIASLLEKSIDDLDKKDCSSLQISGLYVDYGSWESKGKRIKRIRLSTSKGLQDLDLKENKELKVIVPAHLMNKLNQSDVMNAADLAMSVGEAMLEYISKTNFKNNHLLMPPMGLRFTDTKPPPKVVKCNENTGEAVVLTLAVVVMVGALGLLTWYFIIPRIRQRRGSTVPLIY